MCWTWRLCSGGLQLGLHALYAANQMAPEWRLNGIRRNALSACIHSESEAKNGVYCFKIEA
jgi:hypothetical protein